MAVTTKNVNENALVYYDTRYTQRWLDAFGEDVIKFLTDNTTDISNFTQTATSDGAGTSKIEHSVSAGQMFLITTAAADYDGLNIQKEGEYFDFDTSSPFYFGIKLQVNDADKCEFVAGLFETEVALMNVDTEHALAIAGDGVFLSNVGTATTLDFKVYKDGGETNTVELSNALGDAADIVFEMYWDGSTLYAYENDELIGSATSSLPDGDLTPSVEFRTAEADVNTMAISWIRCIQCR